jgi:hypothetical protein
MHDSLFFRKPIKPGLALLLLACATANAASVAHDKNGALLGAAWLHQPTDKADASPELALAARPGHRRHALARLC